MTATARKPPKPSMTSAASPDCSSGTACTREARQNLDRARDIEARHSKATR